MLRAHVLLCFLAKRREGAKDAKGTLRTRPSAFDFGLSTLPAGAEPLSGAFEFLHEVHDVVGNFRIKVTGGFVSPNNCGVVDQ